MKICLIAPVPPFRGGIAKYCYALAQELERRHELLLLSYKRQYPELLYGKKSQIDPNISRADIAMEFKQLSYDIDSASILSWLATSEKIVMFDPDLVICHVPGIRSVYPGLKDNILRRTCFVLYQGLYLNRRPF